MQKKGEKRKPNFDLDKKRILSVTLCSVPLYYCKSQCVMEHIHTWYLYTYVYIPTSASKNCHAFKPKMREPMHVPMYVCMCLGECLEVDICIICGIICKPLVFYSPSPSTLLSEISNQQGAFVSNCH